jgi:predicted transcriptional regulator of viral defense system
VTPLATAPARLDGLILASDVAMLHGSSRGLPRAVARGELVRIRRGVYVETSRWADADSDERYRMRVRAAALTRLVPLHVSHLSAAAMHRLPMVGTWPTVVHALTPGAPGGSSKHGIVTHSRVPPAAVVVVDDVLVTTLERTLMDVAATAPATLSVPMPSA